MHALLWNDGVASERQGCRNETEGIKEHKESEGCSISEQIRREQEREENITAVTYKREIFHTKYVDGVEPGYMLKNRLSLNVEHEQNTR